MTTTTNTKSDSALIKVGGALLPSQPLRSIELMRTTWHELQGQANLVSPVASVDTIPAMHGISLRAVVVDSSTDAKGQGPEVYRDSRFCEDGEVALGGVALQKIAAAAGVQVLSRKRLDDHRDPCYCEVEITLGIQDYDGTWRQVVKARELDLRDGRPEAMKPEKKQGPNDRYPKKTGRMVPLDPSALADKRRHIQSLCETKAFHRALRTLLQLKQKYTRAELAKPFVVPKLVPALDPGDPDQKRALIEMAVGREVSLYGHAGGPMRETKDVTPAREPSRERAGTEDAPSPSGQQGGEEEVGSAGTSEPLDEADFEVLEFPDDEGPVAVCACPCGCQAELTEEVAKIGLERIGTPRCRECYPARSFSVKKHGDVDDLEIPKMQGLTAARVIAGLKGSGR